MNRVYIHNAEPSLQVAIDCRLFLFLFFRYFTSISFSSNFFFAFVSPFSALLHMSHPFNRAFCLSSFFIFGEYYFTIFPCRKKCFFTFALFYSMCVCVFYIHFMHIWPLSRVVRCLFCSYENLKHNSNSLYSTKHIFRYFFFLSCYCCFYRDSYCVCMCTMTECTVESNAIGHYIAFSRVSFKI